jgi:hypothetical protein
MLKVKDVFHDKMRKKDVPSKRKNRKLCRNNRKTTANVARLVTLGTGFFLMVCCPFFCTFFSISAGIKH